MNPTIKNILGVVAGVVVFMITVMLIQLIGHALMPPPPGVEISSPEALSQYVADNPVALVPVLLAYIVGSFAGGFTAAAIANTWEIPAAVTVGIFGMIGNLMNVKSVPHPLWFIVVSFLVFVPLAYVGGRIAAARNA